MIGIPERELGVGLVERINSVAAIRNAMNETGTYCPLHVLGTGNPRSLVLFSIAGADSFDGLEWCQTCVDYETHTLHHLSHMDLYMHQSGLEGVQDIAPAARALTHNILYFEAFMKRLRSEMQANNTEAFAQEVCGRERYERLLGASEGLRRQLSASVHKA
jgi:queuine/archaeosine tRNA-ribosyltransferase